MISPIFLPPSLGMASPRKRPLKQVFHLGSWNTLSETTTLDATIEKPLLVFLSHLTMLWRPTDFTLNLCFGFNFTYSFIHFTVRSRVDLIIIINSWYTALVRLHSIPLSLLFSFCLFFI